MTISLEKPEIKKDYFGSLTSTVLAAVSAVTLDAHNTLSNLRDAFKAFQGKESDTPENRAWVWAVQTITYAAGDMLLQARMLAPLSAGKDKALKTFLDEVTKFENVEFDDICLRSPASSPIFENARKALPNLLLSATAGSKLDVGTIRDRFDAALMRASRRVFFENSEYLKPLEAAFLGVSAESGKREFSWMRHHRWISNQFLETPIFSPDEDENIPLSEVYLRLRCFWNEEREKKEDERSTKKVLRYAHVADLHDNLHDWLDAGTKDDSIRVVTGGPGSGKSSFARAYGHEVIEKGKHRVALIRLQQMRLTSDLREDIGRYFKDSDHPLEAGGNMGLPENPLEWQKWDKTPLLLIFDGLDELTTNEEEHKKNAREFLLSLKRLLDIVNGGGALVSAIVLGRNIACEEAMKVAHIKLKSMLNVAPIVPMTPEMCRVKASTEAEKEDYIIDPRQLAKNDSRTDYWQRWAEVKNLPAEPVPQAITHESMSELNHEPLLLHLLIISKYCGDGWESAAANKNLVYQDILEKIYNRNKAKDHFSSFGLEKDDFFSLMECLGIAAWRGNGRTGNSEDFQRIRALHIDDEVRFEKINAVDLKSVALNIHTRSTTADDAGGFEFIHKSFGEYLAARALISHGKKLAKALERRHPDQVVADWSELVGPGQITGEIVPFVYNEAVLACVREKSSEYKGSISKLLSWIIINGAPTHRLFGSLSWREIEFRQSCVETATLILASAFASVLPIGKHEDDEAPKWLVNIDWGADWNSALKFLHRTGVTTQSPAILCTSRLNLEERNLYSVTLHRADLRGANLARTELNVSNLVGANLERACLSKANLAVANLTSANLTEANLHKADLTHANLRGATLIAADLREANLENVILYNSYLNGANLEDANLEDANLEQANFANANLANVNLSGANLSSANLTGANLSSANLTGANLLGANIKKANLEGAKLHYTEGLTKRKLKVLEKTAADIVN